MTDERIESARKAIDGSTPPPWEYCGCGKCGQIHAPERDAQIAKTFDENDHELHFEGVPTVGVDEKVANARALTIGVNALPAALRLAEAVNTYNGQAWHSYAPVREALAAFLAALPSPRPADEEGPAA